MEIRMPIKFNGTYTMIIRSEGREKKERCQKLIIRELTEKEKSIETLHAEQMPTHQITFYDFGCKRILDGRMKENGEERVVFQVQDKEYEFAPFRPSR